MRARPGIALLALIVAIAGSSSSPVGAAPDTATTREQPSTAAAPADIEGLRQRAAAFWAARVDGDSKAQWDLLEPRGRGRLTPGEYAPERGAMKYLAYQVEDATVRGYFAEVKVRVLVQPILPPAASRMARNLGPASTMVRDRWIRIRGTWYRSLEQEGAQMETAQQ